MDKIVKFFECLVPITVCNLKCEYCYVIQRENRTMKPATFKYTPEQIGEAFNQKRLGGICYVSICGAGETLIQEEVVDIVYNILKQGHYVNITNNGTMTKNIKKLMSFPKEYLSRIHFSFSLHYNELVRLNLLDTFFDNVNLVKKCGSSFIVQLNLCDSYIDRKEDIKQVCMDKIGAYPQIAVTRDEECYDDMKFFTKYSNEEYINFGKEFSSKMFDFGVENIKRKQTQFCYAGKWSYVLNLSDGKLKRCYADWETFDFIENPNAPLPEKPIGIHCSSPYCINSIHFLALGVVPQYKCESYAEIRDRECVDGTHFLNERMNDVLNQKLYDNNKVISPLGRFVYEYKKRFSNLLHKILKK